MTSTNSTQEYRIPLTPTTNHRPHQLSKMVLIPGLLDEISLMVLEEVLAPKEAKDLKYSADREETIYREPSNYRVEDEDRAGPDGSHNREEREDHVEPDDSDDYREEPETWDDIASLRLTSRSLAAAAEPLQWRTLNLGRTRNVAKKLIALLLAPRLRSSVRTILFPNFKTERERVDEDDIDVVSAQPRDVLFKGITLDDFATLVLCGISDSEGNLGPDESFEVPSVATQAMAVAIVLLCPGVHTLDLVAVRPDTQWFERWDIDEFTAFCTLKYLWGGALNAPPDIEIRTPRIRNVRLWSPYFGLGGSWNLADNFPAFVQTPGVRRLDIVGGPGKWTLEDLSRQEVFAHLEDLRLDPEYIKSVVRSSGENGTESHSPHSDFDHYAAEAMRYSAASTEPYFRHVAGSLKRLHWSFRSRLLSNWDVWSDGRLRPEAPLGPLPLLTNLVHLETDLNSLFSSPYDLCRSSTRLEALLPSSLKVVRLSEVWCNWSEPCPHRVKGYRRGLYNSLVSIANSRETRFPSLESLALIFPPEENLTWWAELRSKKDLCWFPTGAPAEDVFSVLKEGTSEGDVFTEYCREFRPW